MEQKPDNMDGWNKDDKETYGNLGPEQLNKMSDVEIRVYDFLMQNKAKAERVNVARSRIVELMPDIRGNNPPPQDPMNFVRELLNIFTTDPQDENIAPRGRKRTISTKKDDPNDAPGRTKKSRTPSDKNTDEEPEKPVTENELVDLDAASRQIDENIATIQSRIHMVKEMWKHRCGDN